MPVVVVWAVLVVVAVAGDSDVGSEVVGAGAASSPVEPAPSAFPPVDMTTRPASDRSGLPWASGVFLPHYTPQKISAFERWRGRPVDLVLIWTERATWSQVTDPSGQLQTWQGTGRRLVIGTAMLPDDEGSLSACARGDYNGRWRSFGQALTRYGFGDSIIRLGWEFNGDWYRWSAGDPEAFVGCWRQVVDTVRRDAPELLWDWGVSRGAAGGLADPRRAYPGDAYVDFVGVDSYDHWPAATSYAVFAADHAGRQNQGMGFWADFARSHGKLLSVPEWGNRTIGQDVGGDNPRYVAWMKEFFVQNADLIAYESLFQADGGGFDGGRLPRSAAAYLAAFGPDPVASEGDRMADSRHRSDAID